MQVEVRFSNEPKLKIYMAWGIDEALRKCVLIRDSSAIPDTQVKTIMLAAS